MGSIGPRAACGLAEISNRQPANGEPIRFLACVCRGTRYSQYANRFQSLWRSSHEYAQARDHPVRFRSRCRRCGRRTAGPRFHTGVGRREKDRRQRPDHPRLHRRRHDGPRPPRRLPRPEGRAGRRRLRRGHDAPRGRQEARSRRRYAEQIKSGTYKGCAAYNDFRELLGRKDIDAVVIATPDHWHAIPAIEACKAKQGHLLREAAVADDPRGQGDDRRGAQARPRLPDRQPAAHRVRRHVPHGRAKYVRSGRIGKVKTVHVGVGGPSKPCDLPEETPEPGLDWDRWLGPAPERPYNSILSPRGVHNHFPTWRNYREYSGGRLTDLGAHHFDIAQWGLDMDDSGPVEIIPPEDPKAERRPALSSTPTASR